MTEPPKPPEPPDPNDSPQASAEEEAELRRMREAIMSRSDRRWWQLMPRKTLFKAFWLLLLLLAILWLQRNSARMAGSYNDALSPGRPPGSQSPPSKARAR